MRKARRQHPPKRQRTIEAVAAFVELMYAHERADLDTFCAVQGKLARLGVAVRVAPVADAGREGGSNA